MIKDFKQTSFLTEASVAFNLGYISKAKYAHSPGPLLTQCAFMEGESVYWVKIVLKYGPFQLVDTELCSN